MWGGTGSLSPDGSAGEHRIDNTSIPFEPVVKEGKAAVSMAHGTKHRRHPIDRALDRRRDFRSTRLQGGANIEQISKHLGMTQRIAAGVSAIGKDLDVDFAFEETKCPIEVADTQAQGRCDPALRRGEAADVAGDRRRDTGEVSGLHGRRLEEPLSKTVLAAGEEKL